MAHPADQLFRKHQRAPPLAPLLALVDAGALLIALLLAAVTHAVPGDASTAFGAAAM